MRWSTHVVAGLCTTGILLPILPIIPDLDLGLWCVAVVAGSLVPDLDACESKIKHLRVGNSKPFHLISQVAFRSLGHRGLLHSLMGWGLAAALVSPLSSDFGWEWLAGFVSGYGAHLAADACTVSGVRYLYPRKNSYHLLKKKWRFVTGSQGEDVIFALLSFIALAFLVASASQLAIKAQFTTSI